ncbi:pimeloyl-ACP methyl ester carboxylesterase [Paucimonas lemoignei]|uniref:Pimeloyl-ACP methyl ester carboxylesterase n=1 Tax=Paucimonas lemoignei TaxID=29443 RepID=A0A4V2UIY8_PAULE|nr:alpha/beta hydrolase [Paucimonas lemoignei]TCS38010.1 pimeloyl-ACP methyl ester carboxylesterase [Paucimonas lemoignei]
MMTSPLQSVHTGLLEIHYADTGPRDGEPVILLHGWPDGIATWSATAAALNAAGFRTIAPYLRGFGPNRFLHDDTPRSAQITALAQDVLDLADLLGLPRFAMVGHDWGARTGYVLAAQAAHRLTRYVSLSIGYGSSSLSFRQAQQFWYQWFFAHPQGVAALQQDRRALCRSLWQSWSPGWRLSDAEFDAVAGGFDNPDWLDITLHGYRHRWGLADADPRYANLETRQQQMPAIAVPTLLIHGADDGCITLDSSAGSHAWFTGEYQRIVLPGVGHFPQREAAAQTAELIVEWLRA